jgi:hypothetical protein
MKRRWFLRVLAVGASAQTPGASGELRVRLSTARVSCYAVMEWTVLQSEAGIVNVWNDPAIQLSLTAPSGRVFTVGGFYYGRNLWKVRFAPPEEGIWRWALHWNHATNARSAAGSFEAGPAQDRGPVRLHPGNPFRFVCADGSLYPAIGIQDCLRDTDHSGSPIDEWGLDGGFRSGGQHDEKGSLTDIDRYLTAYSQAGFNLFRWSVDNCAFRLWDRIDAGGNVYLEREGYFGDVLAATLRKYGFRILLTIFNRPAFPKDTRNRARMEAVRRYAAYVVNRYGAYVDFWELMNEFPDDSQGIDPDWYSQVAGYIRSIDPYHHLISTSWERPDLKVIDMNAPHWYQKESELESDRVTYDRVLRAKGAGKPVLFGEQGNQVQNWDARSALRMRLRSWTAFFAEGVLVFWNSSFAKDYRNDAAANLYLGPDERTYVAALQRFTTALGPDIRPAKLEVAPAERVRGYALQSGREWAAYLHAYTNHEMPTTGASIRVSIPASGKAQWYRPETGRALPPFEVRAGAQTLAVPPFLIDIALIVNGSFAVPPPVGR